MQTGTMFVLWLILSVLNGSESAYIMVNQLVTYAAANQYCQSNFGTNLATILSAEQNVQAATECSKQSNECWIGFSDISNEGSYVWESGQPVTWFNWASGEPNDGGSTRSDDCGKIYSNSYGVTSKRQKWDDEHCTHTEIILCDAPIPQPTTIQPTTNTPTTDAPTTSTPTNNPITTSPTTSAPTTSSPTTSNPTTNSPITSMPTTSAPVTASPTSSMPTTSIPTTKMPTTVSPITSDPTTTAPTTFSPTTISPTTNTPTTTQPTTISPTPSNPVTSDPTTSIPTTNSPSTSNPTNNIPTTTSPTITLPTTSIPSTSNPTTHTPTITAPTTINPTTDIPTTQLICDSDHTAQCECKDDEYIVELFIHFEVCNIGVYKNKRNELYSNTRKCVRNTLEDHGFNIVDIKIKAFTLQNNNNNGRSKVSFDLIFCGKEQELVDVYTYINSANSKTEFIAESSECYEVEAALVDNEGFVCVEQGDVEITITDPFGNCVFCSADNSNAIAIPLWLIVILICNTINNM